MVAVNHFSFGIPVGSIPTLPTSHLRSEVVITRAF